MHENYILDEQISKMKQEMLQMKKQMELLQAKGIVFNSNIQIRFESVIRNFTRIEQNLFNDKISFDLDWIKLR